MSLLDDAERAAWGVVGPVVRTLPTIGDFTQILDTLSQAEQHADQSRQRLSVLASVGAANRADLKDYSTLRENLYKAQKGLYDALTEHVPDFVRDYVPAPVRMPEIRNEEAPNVGTTALRPLGQVAEGTVAAGAAALNPWMWAGIVVAVVVGLAITLYMSYLTAEAISRVFVVWIQSHQYSDLLDARWRAYSTCLQQGTSPSECARIAAGVAPTPRESLPDIAGPVTMGQILGYSVLTIGAGALGFFGFKWWKKRKRVGA